MVVKNIMVCVTQQKTCERLIRKGFSLKKGEDCNLYIINAVHKEDNFLNETNDVEALEYLFKVSEKSGAELTVLKTDNIIESMINFAKENQITDVIMGKSPNFSDENHPLASNLKEKMDNINYIIL